MKANFLQKAILSFQNSKSSWSKIVEDHYLLLFLASTGLITRVLVGCEWRIIILFKIDTLGHKHLSPLISSCGSHHELDLS